MIQIYRFYKMCVLISLFIEPSYFSYLISYTNSMIIVQNKCISLFIPVVLPVVDMFLIPYFELSTSWQVHKEVSKNKVTACLAWNSVMGLQI